MASTAAQSGPSACAPPMSVTRKRSLTPPKPASAAVRYRTSSMLGEPGTPSTRSFPSFTWTTDESARAVAGTASAVNAITIRAAA